jgi:TetR/AcrR family transcriptional regulator, mexJK operon transcriptional repressor
MLNAHEFACGVAGPGSPAFVDLPKSEAELRVVRRRQAFVEVARLTFFDKGFAGTSMSSISARVGGSKTTLWTYFPSKESLFAAVVDDIVERYGIALSIDLAEDEPVELVLHRFGAALLSTVLSDPVIALHRLVLGEASRFPQLAEMFYARGERRGQRKLAAYFEGAMCRGTLRDGDPALAARQFAALCLSGSFQLALLGIEKRPSTEVIASEVRESAFVLMKAWRPEPS